METISKRNGKQGITAMTDYHEQLARSTPVPKWLLWTVAGLVTYCLVSTFYMNILRIQIDRLHSRLISLEFCDMQYNASEIVKIQENHDWHRGIIKMMFGLPITKEENEVFKRKLWGPIK